METTLWFGVLAFRGLKLLKHVDPVIAGVVLLIVAVILLITAARCFYYFVTLDRHASFEEAGGAIAHGVGYFLFAGLCSVISLLMFAEARKDPNSIGYGTADNMASRPNHPTPEDFEPGRTPTIRPSDLFDSRFDNNEVEVRQPNRDRVIGGRASQSSLGTTDLPDPTTRRPVRPSQPTREEDAIDVRLPPSRANNQPEVVLPTTAEVTLPVFQYELEQAQKSDFAGVDSGQDFRGHGPAGSVLVGIRVGTNQGRVTGLEPVYQLADKYVTGSIVGTMGDTRELVLAKPGYVVGGALVASNQESLALQLRFVKYDASDNALDVFDQYDSQRMGRSNGQVIELDGKGAMVVGFFGKQDNDGICGFGVAGLQPSAGQTTTATNGAATNGATANVLRVWFSEDRKFNVEAKLQEIKNGKAVLLKPDGSVIEVDPTGLCAEDRAYLKSRQ